ncbi:MAG: hypothetical protein GTO30_14080, partial [Acidobacteria bacterium]|nr:hypothetical protein [Acidobacteriota bacterium]NIQ84875.1 hypothetical protein [Acidobacteriota bacterium]
LDAYVTNGHIFERPARADLGWKQRDLLLLGDASGGFREARCGTAFTAVQVGRGLAGGDYDDDGDLDVAIVNNGGPLQLLRNDGAAGEWIGFALQGEAGNTNGVGARVMLHFPDGDAVRWVTAGDSYQSTSDPRVLFGWTAGRKPLSVSIRWRDGESVEWGPEAWNPGHYHRVVEADGTLAVLEAAASGKPRPSLRRIAVIGGFVLAALVFALLQFLRRSR